jgi:(p)ppGpp synthase/HD superfamily hydrolase
MREQERQVLAAILTSSYIVENPYTTNYNLYSEAKDFAKERHEGQMYGDVPYTAHLNDVANIFDFIVACGNSWDADAFKACLLHDVVEDTATTHEEIEHKFGADVAYMVHFVTKSEGLSRPEALKELIERIDSADMMKPVEVYAVMVKMADRMSNMMRSWLDKSPHSQKRYEMYKLEGELLNAALLKKLNCKFECLDQRKAFELGLHFLSHSI